MLETERARTIHLQDTAAYADLITGKTRKISRITIPAQGFYRLKKL